MDIINGSQIYKVGERRAKNGKCILYLCLQEATKRECLLQIAVDKKFNADIDRNAYILRILSDLASLAEREYQKIPENKGKTLGYNVGFPELIDSFLYEDKQVNILGFEEVENPYDILPLSKVAKEGFRVDLRTSAWIMGKTLKIIDFAHGEKIVIDATGGNNILLERDRHYVNIFDWTGAKLYSSEIPEENLCSDISKAAQAVITALGGDWKMEEIPNDGDDAYFEYTNFLFMLANGGENNAKKAHTGFYQIVDKYWKKEFYPFTIMSL